MLRLEARTATPAWLNLALPLLPSSSRSCCAAG